MVLKRFLSASRHKFPPFGGSVERARINSQLWILTCSRRIFVESVSTPSLKGFGPPIGNIYFPPFGLAHSSVGGVLAPRRHNPCARDSRLWTGFWRRWGPRARRRGTGVIAVLSPHSKRSVKREKTKKKTPLISPSPKLASRSHYAIVVIYSALPHSGAPPPVAYYFVSISFPLAFLNQLFKEEIGGQLFNLLGREERLVTAPGSLRIHSKL